MNKNKLLAFHMMLVFVILLASVLPSGAQTPNITMQPLPGMAGGQMIPVSADMCKSLPTAQRAACEAEIQRSGGMMTPGALQALKDKAGTKGGGTAPDEAAKGRQLTEQKERQKITAEEYKEKSLFDRSRNIGKYQDISTDLKRFGADFFTEAEVSVIMDRKDVPVPMSYVVGPGDEIKLLLWGRMSAQYNLTVDRDGKITIPQIGPIFVSGLTFEQMSKLIIKQAEQIVGTSVDISMGSPKMIPIFVIGDVKRPGSYTVGAFSTITDALLTAGGPTEIGSMRNIQVKRKGRIMTTFDLYDLLLKGDKHQDVQLLAGDVVFVPVTGPVAGVAGNIRRPALYELKHRYDLENLLELAGGITPSAYTQQIQIERIMKNQRHTVIDINQTQMSKAAEITLQDGDMVKIFPIMDMNVNAVYLSGNVKRPGKYEIKAGMRLGDLIKSPDDLLSETYLDYALIKRLEPPDMKTVLVPINLGKLLLQKDEASNVELKPRDSIYVFNRGLFKDSPFVRIEGEIRGDCATGGKTAAAALGVEKTSPEQEKGGKPGADQAQGVFKKVEIPSDDNAKVIRSLGTVESDLKKQGLTDMAHMVRMIEVDISNGQKVSTDAMLNLRLQLVKVGRPDLANQILDIEQKAIMERCNIPLVDNMRIKDVILIAGGLTSNSYLERAEIIRSNDKREYQTLYFNLGKAMAGDPQENLSLRSDDRIIIHSIWEQVYKKDVAIDGDVANPGTYQYTEGMTVRDLVFKGGSLLESAYLGEAEISSQVVVAGKSVTSERRVINLGQALAGDARQNMVLRPNDRLLVKRIPNWSSSQYVTLTGEFKFPGKYAVQKGEKLSSVIDRAGGYTKDAYLRGAVFRREKVRELQQKSLDEMANRMERELLSESSARAGSSLTVEEVAAKKQESEMKQKLISYMRQLRATGRMTIAMSHMRILKGSVYDIEMEDGDSIAIPVKNSVINVVGSVMSEGSHVYNDKLEYKDYIELAGGLSRYADDGNTFVMKVDGSARKLDRGTMNWNRNAERWELAAYGQEIKPLEPGDVIVVPEKVSSIAWLREIRDITQILMNTAVVAATVIKLF